MRAETQQQEKHRFAQIVRSEIRSFDGLGRPVTEQGKFRNLELNDFRVVYHRTLGRHWGCRSAEQIEQDDADYFVLSVPHSSRLHVQQNQRDLEVHPREMVLIATKLPSQTAVRSNSKRPVYGTFYVRIPVILLRVRLSRVDELCNHRIDVSRGVGAVLHGLLERLTLEATHLNHREGPGDPERGSRSFVYDY